MADGAQAGAGVGVAAIRVTTTTGSSQAVYVVTKFLKETARPPCPPDKLWKVYSAPTTGSARPLALTEIDCDRVFWAATRERVRLHPRPISLVNASHTDVVGVHVSVLSPPNIGRVFTSGQSCVGLQLNKDVRDKIKNNCLIIFIVVSVYKWLITVCSYPKGGTFTTKLHSEN